MRIIVSAFLLALLAATPAHAADPANDAARRCASVYGRVMSASGEGSSAYNAALEGRLALLNAVERREGRLDGAVVTSDDAATAEFKGAPAKLRAAVAACDRANGLTVASGLPRDTSPYIPPAPARAPQAQVAAAPAPPAPARVDRCQVLEAKATDLMETWKFRIGEIANDPYEDKMRRLRDGYDSFRSRLEWIRDDAANEGCSKLASEITDAFTVWVRP